MKKIILLCILSLVPLYFFACNSGSDGGSASPGGTCEGSCAHYLECKGLSGKEYQDRCINSCQKMGLTPEKLKEAEGMSCAGIIGAVEGGSGGSGGSGGGGGGGGSGLDCDRCVWDGSSCIWMSPNAPVTPACDARCCPGH